MLDALTDPEHSTDNLEMALGLVDIWLGGQGRRLPPRLKPQVLKLLREAAEHADADRGGTLNFGRNRVADRIQQDPLKRLDDSLIALLQGAYPSAEDVVAIEGAAEARPAPTVRRVVDFLVQPEWRRALLEWAHLLSVIEKGAGAAIVLKEVGRRSIDDQKRLLTHVDLTTADPDPVFVGMLEANESDDAFRQVAMSQFIYPGEVTVGPLSDALRAKSERARIWASEAASSVIRQWAAELVAVLEPRIADQHAQETEET